MRRATCLVLALFACNADRGPSYRAAGNATPRDGGTLRLANGNGISTLDPTIEYDEVSAIAVHALFDTLIGYGPGSTTLEPHLAERWTISPDGLVYTFELRPQLAYSDGTPVVAADFAYSLERARTTADSPFGPQLADVASIAAPSAQQLVITLNKRNGAFLYILAMTFMTPQNKQHVDEAGDQLRRMPLGTGPFILESWREGEELVLRKNPHYWAAARVHLDRVEWLENIPRDTQFMMFERGDLDAVDKLSAADYLWLLEQPAWKPFIEQVAVATSIGSRMNVRVKPFDDVRVRQALNYAHDKQHSIKLLIGQGVPSHGLLPPGTTGRDDTLAPYPYDPAKARALLAAAGYPNGFATDYAMLDDDTAQRITANLQQELAAVGVRMHITVMSLATFSTAIGQPDGPAFSMDGWIGDYPDASNFLEPRFHSRSITDSNSMNESFYANPRLDALLDEARGEIDQDRRKQLYGQAERILYDDAPWIWDYHEVMTQIVQPYVRDCAPHPVWVRDFTNTWLDLDAGGQRVHR